MVGFINPIPLCHSNPPTNPHCQAESAVCIWTHEFHIKSTCGLKSLVDWIYCVFLFSSIRHFWIHISCFLVFCAFLCQGYPQALLPLTVAGIPSIHICLDFIPELLAQPQLEKQVSPPLPSLPLFFLALNPEPFMTHTYIYFYNNPVYIFVPWICGEKKVGVLTRCVHADLCNPVAVVLVHAVRPTQVSECGQVGHQCHGHPPHRSVDWTVPYLYVPYVYTFGCDYRYSWLLITHHTCYFLCFMSLSLRHKAEVDELYTLYSQCSLFTLYQLLRYITSWEFDPYIWLPPSGLWLLVQHFLLRLISAHCTSLLAAAFAVYEVLLCSVHSVFFSADSCQAFLILHAHPAVPGALLPGLPAALWWRCRSACASGPGLCLRCCHQSQGHWPSYCT